MSYSDKQIKFIKDLWETGDYEWQEVAALFNDEFDDYKTANAIRKTYKRFEEEEITDDTIVKNMETARKREIENKKLKKQQQFLIDSQITVRSFWKRLKRSSQLLILKSYGLKNKQSLKERKTWL